VFASSFAMFAAGRAFEQIRNSIAYPKLNVKICATHAGLAVGEDGASHQAIEDLALMRAIPNMVVLQPCDDISTREVIQAVADYQGPCYIRLGRSAVEDVYTDTAHFQIGKGAILKKGSRIAVIASGSMVQEAIKATQDMNVTLIDMPCIKPIDRELIIETAKTHDVLVTVEEHTVLGGLGSAVAEVLAPYTLCKQMMIGVQDTFGESGKPSQLFEKYGIDAQHIKDVLTSL
ncbi:transketolase family protein, partial [[Eubacterium] hominis]|uniref:transketolase family protein n=1 Tax=[Eubacterium] hominis TaxID=2764325 RepID=UPI003A4D75C3